MLWGAAYHCRSDWLPNVAAMDTWQDSVSAREKSTVRNRRPRRLPYGGTALMPWDLACPTCRSSLTSVDSSTKKCARCACEYRCEGRIWRFLAQGREEAFREFIRQYE